MAKERAFYCLNEQFVSNTTGDIFSPRSSERFGNKHLALVTYGRVRKKEFFLKVKNN